MERCRLGILHFQTVSEDVRRREAVHADPSYQVGEDTTALVVWPRGHIRHKLPSSISLKGICLER